MRPVTGQIVLHSSQRRQKPRMNIIEAAVAENHHDVPALRERLHPRDDLLNVRLVKRRFPRRGDVRHHLLGVQPLVPRGFAPAAPPLPGSPRPPGANAAGNACWKTARRVVFERGSKIAQMRLPAYWRRNPESVWRIAVG